MKCLFKNHKWEFSHVQYPMQKLTGKDGKNYEAHGQWIHYICKKCKETHIDASSHWTMLTIKEK